MNNFEYNQGKPLRLQRPMTDCDGCYGCSDWEVKWGLKPCIKLIKDKKIESDVVYQTEGE